MLKRLRFRLMQNPTSARVIQAIFVGFSVRPTFQFFIGLLLNRFTVYAVRRTGIEVMLRPRADLAVGREYIFRSGPVPPKELEILLEREPPSVVLDLGANIGLFTLWVLEHYPACTIVAVEPDQDNVTLLKRNLELNGLQGDVEVLVAAAGVNVDIARLEAGRAQLSRLSLPGEPRENTVEVPVIDVLPLMASSDMVKIDIEGSEWAILQDPRLIETATRVILLEWHKRGSDSNQPKEFAEQLLRQAGFEVKHDPGFLESNGFLYAWRG